MQSAFNNDFIESKATINQFIANFGQGELFVSGKRNSIRLFPDGDHLINIKSFRIPNLINSIVYRYFRKSKARRSFENAVFLLSNNIGTPTPVAFFENHNFFGLKDSYYASLHLEADLTFRELVLDPDYPDHENILRQFTRFSFDLHQNGIEFLDHSPGNTLIKSIGNGSYQFYLVDLNRMNFHSGLSLEQRMKNLSRLTPKREMIQVICNEYAEISGIPEQDLFDLLWMMTSSFQKRFKRKKQLKKRFLFWK